MSSSEPLWFCYQCQAVMRPLMTPDPVCASCRGSFVEKLDNPADDPRDFRHHAPDLADIPALYERPRPAGRRRSQANPSATFGLRSESHSAGDGITRTFIDIIAGSDAPRRSPPPHRSSTALFEFLRNEADNHPVTIRANGDINSPVMIPTLLALFGPQPPARADTLAEMLGNARLGDYVFNQDALDHILTQIGENSTAGRPVPATEEIIDNLPREVLCEGSPLLERECAVCKESFQLHPEDPDESIVVTLPCQHPFHETCILPWLKSSGTCPVCRFALIAQPQQHPGPGGPSQASGSSSSNRTNLSPEPRPQSSGNSDRGGASSFFHALFGGSSSGNSGNRDTLSARSRRNLGRGNRNTRPEAMSHSTPPFPGEWVEDID